MGTVTLLGLYLVCLDLFHGTMAAKFDGFYLSCFFLFERIHLFCVLLLRVVNGTRCLFLATQRFVSIRSILLLLLFFFGFSFCRFHLIKVQTLFLLLLIVSVLPSFTGFLPSFTGFYRVLLSFTELGILLPSFTGFYLVLPSFT